MASQIITVDNLISEVRSMLDEQNLESLTDEGDILPALNRAQNYAANILARHYEPVLLTYQTVTTVPGQNDYLIPEDAFEQRIEKVEIKSGNSYQELTRLSYRDISSVDTDTAVSFPYYYTVINNRYRLVPGIIGQQTLRVWYLKDPAQLVTSQGRINIVNTAGNYVIVDEVGTDLTTEVDQLNSYVNIIDGQTGERKASFQIQNIINNKITFKTVPTRSTVLNVAIDTSLSSLLRNTEDVTGPDLNIEPDDFICIIRGSCVPVFKKPFSNFLIEYAVAELTRKLGDPGEMEQRVLEKLEKQVERSWVGREQSLRVKQNNPRWGSSNIIRRFFRNN